jgi:acetate kinase
MGISPLEGGMMGTRSGTVDPAVLPYVCGKENLSIEEIVNVQLNKKSGIFGFTGKTDMRDIEKGIKEGDESCKLAHKLYCYKIRCFLAEYLGILDYNLDAIVFAGGVGENDTTVRREVTKGFEKIGLTIDTSKNEKAFKLDGPVDISAETSEIKTLVVPTDEEIVILEDVIGILNGTYDVHTKFTYSFEK